MAEKVLLGFADRAMNENEDSICGWSTNKLGGSPNWMHGPPKETLSCSICGTSLCHVSQAYCPMDNSSYHRVLYIFACVNPRCWNQNASWRVLRSQSLDSNYSTQQPHKTEVFGQENNDWCDDSEDWGDSDSTFSGIESVVGRLTLKVDSSGNDVMSDQECAKERASSTTVADSTPEKSAYDVCAINIIFAPYYVSVFEQTNDKPQTSQMSSHERELVAKYERLEGTRVTDLERNISGSSCATVGETYEKTVLKHGDQAFYKFYKELQNCPHQCLRYMWNGKPLTISGKDAAELKEKVPNCPHCGGERVYELQLMPALVHLLRGTNTAHQPVHNNKLKEQQANTDTKDSEKFSVLGKLSPNRLNEGVFELELQKNSVKQPCIAHNTVRFDSANSLSQEMPSLDSEDTQKHFSIELDSQDFYREQSDISADIAPVIAEESLAVSSEELLGVLTSKTEATVEFGTVIVYTCASSCWTESCSNTLYREEFALVEPDPDSVLFK